MRKTRNRVVSVMFVGFLASAALFPVMSQAQTDTAPRAPKFAVDAVEFHARLAEVIADKPDLVIFQTGTNDPLRGLPLDEFIALTRADIQTIRAAGIDVMLMEPQFCRVFADKPGAFTYVEAVRDLGAEFGIPVIRRWDLMKEWLARHVARPDQLEAPDGLHMADRGYALLARVVTRMILADSHAPRLMASGE
jgi:lysophospholipase L1-like esterase